MKLLIYTYLLFFSVSIVSCKYLISRKYHFNTKFDFTEKNKYDSFLKDKKKFDTSRVIYPDANSYDIFLAELASNNLSVYYGCLKNDSTEMIKSPDLKDNLSCAGRILTEIQNNDSSTLTGELVFIKSNFGKFKFKHLNDGRTFNINDSEKKLKVVLLYGYQLGTYFDKYYKSIQNYFARHQDDVDLFIITIDPVLKLY